MCTALGTSQKTEKISTGITGLDEIMMGGLLPSYSYMLRGGPGTGKTTIGLQFLLEGARQGEQVLFISLEESEEQIKRTAGWLGFDASGVSFLDLSPNSDLFVEAKSYDIFSSAEVENEPMIQKIVAEIARIKPKRVFVDPLTQFRYLSSDQFQFHRQMISFFRFLSDSGATVLLSSENSPQAPDEDVQFLVHSVIQMEHDQDTRSLYVLKYRNSDYMSGWHTYRLTDQGAVVCPRLNPASFGRKFSKDVMPTGIDELDMLMGGGIEKGTINLISGASGVGKTTLGLKILTTGAALGNKAVVFSFEEEIEMMLARCDAIGIESREQIDRGMLRLVKVEPLLYSANQFALLVREMVEDHGVQLVMLDSTSGYNLAMRKENITDHLHVLCKYLQNMGVTVLITTELSNVTGDFRITENGISYLSDNVIFMRYLEMKGEIRRAIGILKKRLSDFEKTLREFEITKSGIVIGPPLSNLRGLLRGEPVWVNHDDES